MIDEHYAIIIKRFNVIETELYDAKMEREHQTKVLDSLHSMVIDIFKRLGKFI